MISAAPGLLLLLPLPLLLQAGNETAERLARQWGAAWGVGRAQPGRRALLEVEGPYMDLAASHDADPQLRRPLERLFLLNHSGAACLALAKVGRAGALGRRSWAAASRRLIPSVPPSLPCLR